MAQKREKTFLQVGHRVELASTSVTRFKSSLRSGSFVGSRSQLTGSKVMAAKVAPPPKQLVVVRNAEGKDVTPKPLFDVPGSTSNRAVLASIFYAGSKADSSQRQSGQGSDHGSSLRGSVDGQFSEPFSRSTLAGSMIAQGSTGASFQRQSASGRSMAGTTAQKPPSPVLFKESTIPLNLTAEELTEDVLITLHETDTIFLFDRAPSVMYTGKEESKDDANEDSEEASKELPQEMKDLAARNDKYMELCKSRAGNDRYVQRGMQTLNLARKSKEQQTVPIIRKEVGTMATGYDLHDTFSQADATVEQDGDDDSELQLAINEDFKKAAAAAAGSIGSSRFAADGSMAGSATMMSLASSMAVQLRPPSLDLPGSKPTDGTPDGFGVDDDGATTLVLPEDHPLLHNNDLLETMAAMERVLALNNNQENRAVYVGKEPQLAYTIYPDMMPKKSRDDLVAEVLPKVYSWQAPDSLTPNLRPLWAYRCKQTETRNVSCMAWNKLNPDILAVAYGQFTFGQQGTGLVLCWSVKNQLHPDRIYEVPKDVLTLDFSKLHPSILACGLYDGTIHVYNIHQNKSEPIFSCSEHTTKHTGPVWQVSFVSTFNKDTMETEEMLVSVASDGMVNKWAMLKGFEKTELMSLKKSNKRMPKGPQQTLHTTIAHAAKRSEKAGLLHKYTKGFCFDFEHDSNANVYLVGTGEGYIHKCSCSYNEQYLETYVAHTGPVYRVLWSPFNRRVFMTCSGDWTVRFWDTENCQPFESLSPSMKAVIDIAWSPVHPTMFATVSYRCIEIWDFSVNTLDPVIRHVPSTSVDLTFVCFTQDSKAIAVGDATGQVTMYQLRAMVEVEKDQQLDILDDMRVNGLRAYIRDPPAAKAATYT